MKFVNFYHTHAFASSLSCAKMSSPYHKIFFVLFATHINNNDTFNAVRRASHNVARRMFRIIKINSTIECDVKKA